MLRCKAGTIGLKGKIIILMSTHDTSKEGGPDVCSTGNTGAFASEDTNMAMFEMTVATETLLY